MRLGLALIVSAAFDRACVKTHTSAKCRKHNSPARHRTSLVQYDLTPTDAIAQRYFYVWRDRSSFRTAKSQSVDVTTAVFQNLLVFLWRVPPATHDAPLHRLLVLGTDDIQTV